MAHKNVFWDGVKYIVRRCLDLEFIEGLQLSAQKEGLLIACFPAALQQHRR